MQGGYNMSDNIQKPVEDKLEDTTKLDKENQLVSNLRDLGYTIRFLSASRGSQKTVLIILYEAGNMTQRDLTERLGVQPGSASEVIIKLEHAGLIQRTTSREDRRTTDIQLTPAGRKEAKEAAKEREKRCRELFMSLSEDEKDILLNLTGRLNEEWSHRYHEGN